MERSFVWGDSRCFVQEPKVAMWSCANTRLPGRGLLEIELHIGLSIQTNLYDGNFDITAEHELREKAGIDVFDVKLSIRYADHSPYWMDRICEAILTSKFIQIDQILEWLDQDWGRYLVIPVFIGMTEERRDDHRRNVSTEISTAMREIIEQVKVLGQEVEREFQKRMNLVKEL